MNTPTQRTRPPEEEQYLSSDVKSLAVELSLEAALFRPSIAGAMDLQLFSKGLYCTGELDLGGLMKRLEDSMARLSQGDFSEIEAKLFAQAQTLQVLFTYLSQRMLKQEHLKNLESFCRMALKAQDQSRRTLETLVQMKKPSVVIAKQANIAQGPQQVNNNLSENSSSARNEKTSNEQLSEGRTHGKTLDFGMAATASGTDQKMATVAAIAWT